MSQATQTQEVASPDAFAHFSNLAVQYYIAGRQAAMAALMPVAGNLYHHAIEMILKARLSKFKSLRDLKNLGHKLEANWDEFKKLFPEDLSAFDVLIRELDRFERIRYPNAALQEGMAVCIDWNAPEDDRGTDIWGATPLENRVPLYRFAVTELDSFVAKLFEVSSINQRFFGDSLNKIARDVLKFDNPLYQAAWSLRSEAD